MKRSMNFVLGVSVIYPRQGLGRWYRPRILWTDPPFYKRNP
jgi:hypothetical protein